MWSMMMICEVGCAPPHHLINGPPRQVSQKFLVVLQCPLKDEQLSVPEPVDLGLHSSLLCCALNLFKLFSHFVDLLMDLIDILLYVGYPINRFSHLRLNRWF